MDNISSYLLAVALMIIMLGMGLSLVKQDFKNVILFPKAILLGLANQIVMLPIIGFLIVNIFDLEPEIAIGFMILAACPGGATSNLISFMAKADLALSVSLTAISSLITVITIPLIANFSILHFTGKNKIVNLSIIETIAQIFVIVVIPVLIGMIIKHYKPKFALKMDKTVRIASTIIFALVIIGLVVKERNNIIPYSLKAGLPAILLNVLTILFGYFSAKIFSLKKKQALTIAIESGIQNGALAITIAVLILNNSKIAIPSAVYSLVMLTSGMIIILFSKKTQTNN